MKVTEIVRLLEGEIVTNSEVKDLDATSGFVGDLLSVVLGKAKEDCAWVTIQSHINIVGVAAMVGAVCIIVAEGFEVDEDALEKANEEEIVIIKTKISSFEAVSVLAKNGLN